MLDYYNSTRFIDNAGNHNEIPNTMILTDILEDMGFVRGNEWKNNGIHVYPREVFFPKQSAEGKYEPTEKSVGIHYFNGAGKVSKDGWIGSEQPEKNESREEQRRRMAEFMMADSPVLEAVHVFCVRKRSA